ncbi:hypothetical protein [Devosia sp. A369]
MIKTIALPLILGALLTAPALAAPICSGSFALSKDLHSEADINAYNLRTLQSRGIDATASEIWGGCIRAWVRGPDGSQQMQFFEPLNFQRVE